MEKFFKLKENGTTVSTEVIAGLTTFFAVAYIIVLAPGNLSTTGMPWGAVFLSTIIASIVGTLVVGLFANVPYAVAPGVGLNVFFAFTVVKALGFTWQEALCMVLLCGVISVIVTATKLRKLIIQSIPPVLQHAIGGGIGMFVAYIGLVNVGLIHFIPNETAPAGANPGLASLNNRDLWIFLIGLFLSIFFLVTNFKGKGKILNRGAFVIAIVIAALIGIPFGVTNVSDTIGLSEAFHQLPTTFLAVFTHEGFPSLFSDPSRLPLVLGTLFAFVLTDIFDAIGTFIGTGRRAGIFSDADADAMNTKSGLSSKMDRALFADCGATGVAGFFGTSNVTTFVESAAGIAVGGRTGLTSLVVAICFAISTVLAPLVSAIPTAATSPILVIVGCMMMSSFGDIKWRELADAIPAFFTSVFMALSYSISYGIAAGFITYCFVKTCRGEAKKVHPVIWVVAILFIIDLAFVQTKL